MKTPRDAGRLVVILVAAVVGSGAPDPGATAGGTDAITLLRDTPPPLPALGALVLEVRTDVQVIGLDNQGRIVLAREGTMRSALTLEGVGAIEGGLPAEPLVFDRQGWRARRRYARAIAARAASIVRFSTMGAARGPSESTIMARLCPAPSATARRGRAMCGVRCSAKRSRHRWTVIERHERGQVPPSPPRSAHRNRRPPRAGPRHHGGGPRPRLPAGRSRPRAARIARRARALRAG